MLAAVIQSYEERKEKERRGRGERGAKEREGGEGEERREGEKRGRIKRETERRERGDGKEERETIEGVGERERKAKKERCLHPLIAWHQPVHHCPPALSTSSV